MCRRGDFTRLLRASFLREFIDVGAVPDSDDEDIFSRLDGVDDPEVTHSNPSASFETFLEGLSMKRRTHH